MTQPLSVFAAGSLKSAFIPLSQHFTAITGAPVALTFGPAGLLRERIEAGEHCDLFASANTAHPQTLREQGLTLATHTFAFNQLNLTVRKTPATERGDWLSLLADPGLRLGTSTPGCDPSGDYTWALFDKVEQRYPQMKLKARALRLVGGRDTLVVPTGEIASAWLIRNNLTDLFIGYAHYARALTSADDLRILAIPDVYNPRCEYQLAVLNTTAYPLADFILAQEGQTFLQGAGFLTAQAE